MSLSKHIHEAIRNAANMPSSEAAERSDLLKSDGYEPVLVAYGASAEDSAALFIDDMKTLAEGIIAPVCYGEGRTAIYGVGYWVDKDLL